MIEHHSSLPAAFNSTVGVPRLVLLVSPTCSMCLDGVRTVVTSLEELNARDVAVHVVWVGVLDDDSVDVTLQCRTIDLRRNGCAASQSRSDTERLFARPVMPARSGTPMSGREDR